MVVGVEDDEFGQRVAAAVTLQDDTEGQGIGRTLSLERLRSDLRGTLAGYKMPTLLRVVEGLPKTATGKVMKKVLRGEMFPAEGHPDVQVWRKAGVEAPRL
jgi:malonyl-CoA/methylmalonyl-CoA synthetase